MEKQLFLYSKSTLIDIFNHSASGLNIHSQHDANINITLIKFTKLFHYIIELKPRAFQCKKKSAEALLDHSYLMISVTLPEPTVRPPSRIENFVLFSIAIGAINSTVISTLSPGITISVPSGKVITPVTSVVRK